MSLCNRYIGLLALLVTTTGYGATEVEGDIGIEFARYYIGGGNLYRDLPDDFPAFTMPDGLQLLGSLGQGTRQALVFTTDLSRGQAQEALAGAFTDQAGWVTLQPVASTPPTGFVAAGTAAATRLAPVDLCHDTHGMLHITANYLDEVVYLNRSIPARGSAADCARQVEQRRSFGAGRGAGIGPYLPVLEVPAGAVQAPNPLSNDGSSYDAVERGVLLSATTLAPAALENHFADQLRALGWEQDARWAGNLSTGSSWLLAPADAERLVGLLNIVAMADSANGGETKYAISFRMMAN
jgi:hypothetical protein